MAASRRSMPPSRNRHHHDRRAARPAFMRRAYCAPTYPPMPGEHHRDQAIVPHDRAAEDKRHAPRRNSKGTRPSPSTQFSACISSTPNSASALMIRKPAARAEIADVKTHRQQRQKQRQHRQDLRATCGSAERRRSQRETGPLTPNSSEATSSSHGTMCRNVTCRVCSSTTAPLTPPSTDALSDHRKQIAPEIAAQRPHEVSCPGHSATVLVAFAWIGKYSDRQHRRKGDERAAARHRIHHTGDKRGRDQPEIRPDAS